MKKRRIVILYSGGLDSLLMYRYAQHHYTDHEIIPLFFDHGQEAVEQEITALPEGVIIKKMDWLGADIQPVAKKSMPLAGAIYIPGRNMVFTALAASYYTPDEVWLGVLFDENNDRATDKNEEFRNQMTSVLSYVLSPFTDACQVVFPFSRNGWTKYDTIKHCLENGFVTKEELLATTSCWHNDGLPCGKCLQCVKRALIFRNFDMYEQYSGPSPLNSANLYAQGLMSGYLNTQTPDFEERMMQDLVRAFAGGTKTEGIFK